MQIAIGTPIGYPSGAARAAGVFGYLLNDTFTTNRAAGAIDNTLAEPGPGMRWGQLDTNGKLSLSGGNAIFAAGGAAGNDPALRYRTQLARAAGRLMTVTFTVNTTGFEIGQDTANIGSPHDALRFTTTVISARSNTSNVIPVGAFSTGVVYQAVFVQRTAGAFYLIKGGAFSDWTLLWSSTVGSATNWHPCAMVTSTTGAGTWAEVKVPSWTWMPAPIVSDGFSSWGTSDGLGHQEAQLGEALGLGGSGKAWQANAGTWGASGTAAASALTGGQAIATLDASKADLMASINCTLASGTMSLILRWVDVNNNVQVRLTSTNCQLVKTVAGTPTIVSDAAYTYVPGAELRVISEGSAFRRFYNGTAIGSVFTIADAALQTPTRIGLRTDNLANTFDNLRAYARMPGSDYAVLDTI